MTETQNRGGNGQGGQGTKRKRRKSRRRNKPNPNYIPKPVGPTEPGEGILEIQNDGSGFLRFYENNYLAGDDDFYVPPGLIKLHKLKAGSHIEGQVGQPRKQGQKPLLAEVEKVDGMDPEERAALADFGRLLVVDPEPQFVLEPDDGDIGLRIIDLLCPVGYGQRGLIVAPPRSGKTVLMQKISSSIAERYPDVHLIVLLDRRAPRRGDRLASFGRQGRSALLDPR